MVAALSFRLDPGKRDLRACDIIKTEAGAGGKRAELLIEFTRRTHIQNILLRTLAQKKHLAAEELSCTIRVVSITTS